MTIEEAVNKEVFDVAISDMVKDGDCISRKAVLKIIDESKIMVHKIRFIKHQIKKLPSISLTETSDLISRKQVLDSLMRRSDQLRKSNWFEHIEDNHECVGVDWCINEIFNAPSADPQRNTGHWIYGEHDVAMADGYRCDQCGFFVPWDYQHKFIDFIKDYHYCPSCGNPMEEGEQNE